MKVSRDLPPSMPDWPRRPADLASMVAGHDSAEA
jgi:hypothetical protein